MPNGDIDRNRMRRCLLVGALAFSIAGSLAACTPAEQGGSTGSNKTADKFFGPDGYGKLTIGMNEKKALATGELQKSPVSTVLDRNVYSFVGGPKPNPKQMAADEKIELAVRKAHANTSTSAAESAKAAQAYAASAGRSADRLLAYLSAGGATFQYGALTEMAAPTGAATEAGIKRGSTLAELKAAYGSKGLKDTSKTLYELPTGKAGLTLVFQVSGDTVKYMSLGRNS